jgi:hypothetical protein
MCDLSSLSKLVDISSVKLDVSQRSGLGSKNYKAVIISDDKSKQFKATYVPENAVEKFKMQCPRGFYMLSKWMKGDAEKLAEAMNIKVKCRLMWRLIYVNLVSNENLRERRLREKVKHAAIILVNLKMNAHLVRQLDNVQADIDKLEDQRAIQYSMDKQRLKTMHLQVTGARELFDAISREIPKLRQRVKSLRAVEERAASLKSFLTYSNDRTAEGAMFLNSLKNEDWENNISIELDCVTNNDSNSTWFGFRENRHLFFLQNLTGTPQWLRSIKDESQLKLIDYPVALFSLLKICNITGSRQALYMVNQMAANIIGNNIKKKGFKEFVRTFELIFKFKDNFSAKLEAYTSVVSYINKVLNCKTSFRNIYYLLTTRQRSRRWEEEED